MKRCSALLFAVLLAVCCIPVVAAEEPNDPNTVYLSTQGNDRNEGTQEDPLATLAFALEFVPDGGTIHVLDTYKVPSSFTWGSHDKSITVTGGTLDFSSMSTVTLGDSVTFEEMTLAFKSGGSLYANGHMLTVAESTTVSQKITVYGGGTAGSTVASTNVTLLSGTYTMVYGGSNGGTVTGDTHLTVGGTVNPTLDITNHTSSPYFFGGGLNDTIQGNTHVTLTGSAQAMQVFGGSSGASSTIRGSTNIYITGGRTMGMYGGNKDVDTGTSVNLTMTGGYAEQVFGGSFGSSYTGDIHVNILGGEVGRRVYGGCYNDYDGSWKSTYYVTGTIVLTIGGENTITMSAKDEDGNSYSDRSIYARSRQKTISSTEHSIIVFADEQGHSSYKNKLKANDLAGIYMMGSTSAADETHYYTYSVDAETKTVTQHCSYHTSYSATATLALDSETSLTYTGAEICPASFTYDNAWESDPLPITYTNNIRAGTATASWTDGTNTLSLDYTITKASPAAPAVTGVAETIKGKADGKLLGLTTDMEISTDGVNFTPITQPSARFAAGSYTVRYAESENCAQSSHTVVTVAEGTPLRVTFRADGAEDIVCEVGWNETLTDIPAVPEKAGYTQTAPYWNESNFDRIRWDMTVNANYTQDALTETPQNVPSDGTGESEEESSTPSPPILWIVLAISAGVAILSGGAIGIILWHKKRIR